METNPDIIVIESLPVKNIKQCAIINNDVYLLQGNSILKFSLTKSKPIIEKIPFNLNGKNIKYLFKINNTLCLCTDDESAGLFKFNNNIWEKTNVVIKFDIYGYINIKDLIFIFSDTHKKDDHYILVIDENGKYTEILINKDYGNMYGLGIDNKYNLYIGIHNPDEVLIINIENIYEILGKKEFVYNPERVCERGVINIQLINNEVYLARDGVTSIYDKNNKLIFEDLESGESGYQIAALGLLNLKENYQTLGTWRRNEAHPFSCFYILKNLKKLFKFIPPGQDKNNFKPWSGYKSLCKNQSGKNIGFIYDEDSLFLVRGFTSFNEF